jgi:hypothetical protein
MIDLSWEQLILAHWRPLFSHGTVGTVGFELGTVILAGNG